MKIVQKYRFDIFIRFAFVCLLGCDETNESEIKRVRFGLLMDIHLPTMHDSESRMNAFIDSMRIAEPDFI